MDSQVLLFANGCRAEGTWCREEFRAVWCGYIPVDPDAIWGTVVTSEDGHEWVVSSRYEEGLKYHLLLRDVGQHFMLDQESSFAGFTDYFTMLSDEEALRVLKEEGKYPTIYLLDRPGGQHSFEVSVWKCDSWEKSNQPYRVTIMDRHFWADGLLGCCLETPEQAIKLMRNLADRGAGSQCV